MTRSLAARIELAAYIMGLEYPGYSGAWLKAVPTEEITGVDRRDRRALLQLFLADHFTMWTPERAPYSQLVSDEWRAVDREELELRLGEVFIEVGEKLRSRAEADAAERAEAEAGGYLEVLGPPVFADEMIDLVALRSWFCDELWGAPEFWANVPREGGAPAFVGMDDDIVAILWAP